jgi:pentafunctional AROM polypeptide
VIGAVNTVIPVENNGRRELVGENTDWRAIRDLVAFNLTRALSTSTTALIIGAGGTSRAAVYALRQLDFKTIYIFNRTKATAQSLAESFPSEYNIIVLDRLDHFPALPPSVIISTVPASATSLVESSTAILLPKTIFGSVDGGVVIDMAYKPVLTPLLELASAVNHDLSLIERAPPPPGEMNPPPPKWVRLPGISVLLEQGYQQFELWTGRRAPRDAIQKAVWNRYSAS